MGDYFKAKRRDALAPIITGADTDLGTIVATLEDVASTNYVTQLTTERIAMQGFFDPGIAQAQARHETMQVFEMRNAELVEQQRIDARQGAVTSYIAALENIRATHKQIAQAIASDRYSDVASIVSVYIANLSAAVDGTAESVPVMAALADALNSVASALSPLAGRTRCEDRIRRARRGYNSPCRTRKATC